MIAAYQARCQARVDAALDALFVAPREELQRLYEAMRYSVMNGGKRVRPLLAYAACEALGGAPQRADAAACAVELIHAYSLVHDDLPAMDDDDLRRGRPSTHRAFDEATEAEGNQNRLDAQIAAAQTVEGAAQVFKASGKHGDLVEPDSAEDHPADDQTVDSAAYRAESC